MYCGPFLYGSWVYLARMRRIGIALEDLPIPTWVARGMLMVGFGLLAIRLLGLLWEILRGRAQGFPSSDESRAGPASAGPRSDAGQAGAP